MVPPTSCKVCHMRRVVCDRRRPCSRCVADGAICSYAKVLVDGKLVYLDDEGRDRYGRFRVAPEEIEYEDEAEQDQEQEGGEVEGGNEEQREEEDGGEEASEEQAEAQAPVFFNNRELLRPGQVGEMTMPSTAQKFEYAKRLEGLWAQLKKDNPDPAAQAAVMQRILDVEDEVQKIRIAGWRSV